MRSVWRLWWLLLPVLPATSILMSIAIRFVSYETVRPEPFTLGIVIATLIILLSYVALIGSVIYTVVLVFLRFYRHLYTDEGYLTFTLPIKRGDILLSKSLNAMIWLTAHTVLLIACILLILLIAPTPARGALINTAAFEVIGRIFADLWQIFGGWLILYSLEAILIALAGAAFSVALLQLCITVASMLVKKAKLFLGIGIYYAVNSIIGTIGAVMFVAFISADIETAGLTANMTEAQAYIFLAVVLMSIATAISLFAAAFYLTTRNCIERKLNLS